jgi:hypothetical protein
VASRPSASEVNSDASTASTASSAISSTFSAAVLCASANPIERTPAARYRARARWKARGAGKEGPLKRSQSQATAASATNASVQPARSCSPDNGEAHLKPSVARARRYSASAGRSRAARAAARNRVVSEARADATCRP